MFKVKFIDAKFVRSLFEAISGIITETRLKIDPKEGIVLTAMDAAHICLVDLHLKKEDLDLFESKAYYELGINMDDLVKILKRGSAKDELTLIHDPKDKKLVIEMKAENSKKARKFTMALIDIDAEEIDVNQLDQLPFENKGSINWGLIDEAKKDAEIFSEVLQITVKDNQMKLSAEGTMGDMEYCIEKEELITSDFKEESEGNFSIQFLSHIIKIAAFCSTVEFALKSESPIKFKSYLLAPEADKIHESYIQYFLAPRVEEDNDYEADQ